MWGGGGGRGGGGGGGGGGAGAAMRLIPMSGFPLDEDLVPAPRWPLIPRCQAD